MLFFKELILCPRTIFLTDNLSAHFVCFEKNAFTPLHRRKKCVFFTINENAVQTNINRLKDSNIDIKLEYLELILEPIIERLYEKMKSKELEEKPLMTIADIAEKFQVTKTTVQNWIRRGTITGNRVGKNRYFTREEVITALNHHGWKTDSN